MHKTEQQNPFNIPNLMPMLDSVTEFVKKHQGEKGFIHTDNPNNDTIWAFIYAESEAEAIEVEVKAVRVNEHGTLQAMVDHSSTKYTENDVADRMQYDESIFGSWRDVEYDDNLYFVPTIFNIAENIAEYAGHAPTKK